MDTLDGASGKRVVLLKKGRMHDYIPWVHSMVGHESYRCDAWVRNM